MHKILVIQYKMIGDVLVSSILCETLVKAFPDAQVDYLIYDNTWPVIQENAGQYRAVLFTSRQRNSRTEFLKFAKRIRDERYDVIIDAYSKPESWTLVALSGAKRKISFEKGLTNLLYTDLVERHVEPCSNLGLAIEHRLKLLEPLKIPEALYVTRPKIDITQVEREQALAILARHHLNPEIPIAVVNILGSAAAKTYPAQYMATVVDLLARHDVQIVFNYFGAQADAAKRIFEICQPQTQAKVYLGVLDVDMRGFLAVMAQCACIIGNDGGAINMAKALGKPTFTLFSPWIDKKVWATFEDGTNHVSVHLRDFAPQWYMQTSQKQLRKKTHALYLEFRPQLFSSQLEDFCRHHLATIQRS